MGVITISREFATGSEQIASKAAKKLGYEYIGKNLLAKIAEELNISKSEAEVFTKTSSARVLRLVDRYTCSMVQKVVDREHGCLDNDTYYETTKKLVEDLYEEGDVIILGWGGQAVLKNKPGTLHVRVVKDPEEKIEAVMKKRRIDAKAAKKLIDSEEADMKAYLKQFFNEDWNEARLYDLVIDTSKHTVDEAVDLICDNVKHKIKS
jgi:cytidylate kinase